MHLPFAMIAAAVRNIAVWERHRIDFTRDQMLRGQVMPPSDMLFTDWEQRQQRLAAAAEILDILAQHEPAARSLDRRLSAPLLCGAPSMWAPPALTRPSP